MNPMRELAKAQFPAVVLTLLSIVQALALELIWARLHEVDYLYAPSWAALLGWLQIAGTLFGIVLIWVVYASNVMRFRWVPTTSDSVYPFVIGLLEFVMIDALGPDTTGLWLLLLAVIFALMTWVAHATMRRARYDPDNQAFFSKIDPAGLEDFYAQIAIVGIMAAAGAYLVWSDDAGVPALVALIGTNALLGWQFWIAARFWKLTLAQE